MSDADPQSLRVLVLTPPEPDATLIRNVLGQAGLGAHFCADVEELARPCSPRNRCSRR